MANRRCVLIVFPSLGREELIFGCPEFDHDVLPEMGKLGLLGPTIQGYGCAGVSNVAYGLVAREIERYASDISFIGNLMGLMIMHQ